VSFRIDDTTYIQDNHWVPIPRVMPNIGQKRGQVMIWESESESDSWSTNPRLESSTGMLE
jgi:hypothetical protein